MNKILYLIINYFTNSYLDIGQAFLVILGISLIRKYKISGRHTAWAGFMLLFITMLFSIFQMDMIAGKVAEFVWILFAISFVQEFYHFLKHENK